MNKETYKFKPGDFITNSNKPGSFAIFEGIGYQTSYAMYNKYSVIANYDPRKYMELSNGTWDSIPNLDVATSTTRCDQLVDGDTDSFWWRLCTQQEKEKSIGILDSYGYYWNENLLAIIDKNTGEIVRNIVQPKIEYNGETIKPISKKLKDLLRKVCDRIIKNKYSYSYSSSYYGEHGDYYDYWD